MSKNWVVIHEAPADFRIATELADRVLLAEINWLDDAIVEHQRTWHAELPVGSRLKWSSMKVLALNLGIHIHGHFNNEPALPDASAARRAIVYVLRLMDDVDAILLIRDMDDQATREAGLTQAQELIAQKWTIVVGAAKCEREAWVLTGFEPGDEEEIKLLVSETRILGNDPRLHSHELTAVKNDQAKRSPKRVLNVLTRGNPERECTCWQNTPLDILRTRGNFNGLTRYLDAVREKLVPKLTGHQS